MAKRERMPIILAICTTGLVAALGATACKPDPPSEHLEPVRSPRFEMPAYGVCPPRAVNCNPKRLRVLQDSLAALEKRRGLPPVLPAPGVDSLSPGEEWRFSPPWRSPRGRVWRGPEWERRGPMDRDRRELGLPPSDTPGVQRILNR